MQPSVHKMTLVLAPFFAHALGGDLQSQLPVTITLVMGAFVAGLAVTRVRRRSTLLRVGLGISATHVLVWMGMSFFDPSAVWDDSFWRTIIFLSAHGIAVGFLFSGLLPVIEYIFSINGMGKLSFDAILSRDYPVIMAITTITAMLTLVGILVSDLLYSVVDPRITAE